MKSLTRRPGHKEVIETLREIWISDDKDETINHDRSYNKRIQQTRKKKSIRIQQTRKKTKRV